MLGLLAARQSAFSLLMTVHSLLLAFRLNRAAHRHYEARGLCGLMIAKSREVSIGAIAHFSADPKTRDALCEIAVAYPVAFHVHLTGGGGARPKSELRAMLEGIVDEATLGVLLDASHWPNTLTLIAQQRLDAALAAARGTDRAVVAVMFGEEILDSIRAVAVALGGCERIMGTPLPFVVVRTVEELAALLQQLQADPARLDALQEQTRAWWAEVKRHFGSQLRDALCARE